MFNYAVGISTDTLQYAAQKQMVLDMHVPFSWKILWEVTPPPPPPIRSP